MNKKKTGKLGRDPFAKKTTTKKKPSRKKKASAKCPLNIEEILRVGPVETVRRLRSCAIHRVKEQVDSLKPKRSPRRRRRR